MSSESQKADGLLPAAPIAFVFPETWKDNPGMIENGSVYFKFMETLSLLSEEGKAKIFTYAEDIKEIKRYAKETRTHQE